MLTNNEDKEVRLGEYGGDLESHQISVATSDLFFSVKHSISMTRLH